MPAERSTDAPRVLVTGTGGPSGYCVLRGLSSERLKLISADIDPYAVGLYLVPEEERLIVARGDDSRFTELLLAACRRLRVDVLIPTVDSELIPLAERREEFEGAGIALVLATEETLRICLDKWRLHERCAGTVRVPDCELADERFDPASVPLPAFVKPRIGSGSRGIRLIETSEELDRLPRDGSLLVQENLPGPEHSIDVLADRHGEVLAAVPRARLKVDSGIAVTGRSLRDEALQQFGRKTAERIGLTGVANVQVKEAATGEPALLEVNPRFPGTMPLTVASGVDMPKLCVWEALGREIERDQIRFEPTAMVRFMDQHLISYEEIEAQMDSARMLGALRGDDG